MIGQAFGKGVPVKVVSDITLNPAEELPVVLMAQNFFTGIEQQSLSIEMKVKIILEKHSDSRESPISFLYKLVYIIQLFPAISLKNAIPVK